jgi:hypothetical protein
MRTNNKTRSVFQSTKSALSATTDIAVATAELLNEIALTGKDIVVNNMTAMKYSTYRDNSFENSVEVKESLEDVLPQLDLLDAVDVSKLSVRQLRAHNILALTLECHMNCIEQTAKL